MQNWEKMFEKWNMFTALDDSLKINLNKLKNDRSALEDAFYQELSFGTAGMRGILGAGTNRMNIYTIRKAVNGLADYLLTNYNDAKNRGIVIAYDSRYMSKEFAIESAKVLGYYGIHTYVFESLRPTPLLSFAVRHLNTVAGIMITASHNPPEYNGFKVYNEHGAQIVPAEAKLIVESIQQTKDELTVPILEQSQVEEQEKLTWLNDEVDQAYLERLYEITQLSLEDKQSEKDIQIVFTPLHGTALDLVTKGLKQLQFSKIAVVEEQAQPDPEFSTVESPNPEEHQAFSKAINLGKQTNADILLGTDPDADRLGVAVKNSEGEYQVLSGNQLGVLLFDYIVKHIDKSKSVKPRMIKTVVTTELGRAIAEANQVESIDTLTGFKYIGEKINHYDTTGETFLFGFEESYGYLISDFVRDKDAVQAAMMATEMAYYWKQQGKTLFDALDVLYEKYGYYLEGMTSLTLKGQEGSQQMEEILTSIREKPFAEIGGMKVIAIEDYSSSVRTLTLEDKQETIILPKENMIKYLLEDDGWVCFRPSGTEPKIKYYYGVRGTNAEDSEQRLLGLKESLEQRVNRIID
ncbi:phosphomannomutase [Oceanobacillus iheyensis HTE831]|uniref:Phosphoglucomutase n=1 Tax=Oceanobacillus iheyensis (strain DSM 14371 / CIP 107618 / JCM 11309 / KCTC 3954 / HTE831) TaxID=221109 RepID=Q8EM24_OCEIH|nr:phospho-sugar mutase [Oceanobacillus iheyensis]BAC14993.1 phosphomannomutase [Oceanobacillus iheyensis HTE831]